MDRTTYKAAVIGLGFVGAGDQVSGDAIGQKVDCLDGTHAHALASHPQIRLVAGSSRDEGRRERFEGRYHVRKTYADWREMLAREKLDIVSVATNSPFHAEITTVCAEAGVRAIFCEKPIATCVLDADTAIRVCHNHGSILAVNHNRRWHPLWRSVRQELNQGAIGEAYHAVVNWPSGRLGNVGTHMFDALRMLLDAEATEVSGILEPLVVRDCRGAQFHDPGGWGVVTFSNGVRAFIDASQSAKFQGELRVVGSLGQIILRANHAYIELQGGVTKFVGAAVDGVTSMDRAVQDIVRCLTNGGRPACTGEDGLAALEIALGFHVSDRLRGKYIPLPLAGADREFDVRIG